MLNVRFFYVYAIYHLNKTQQRLKIKKLLIQCKLVGLHLTEIGIYSSTLSAKR